ncbi:MAG TPA: thioredoxin domain-containing protein [Thermoanaerobaculia bacterium]|nr:thioredoxin domain-containing protein [Thermoanaerobaculia bacterium]
MKTLLTTVVFLAAAHAFAGEFRDPLLLNYAKRSLMVCPDETVHLETIDETGPANFTTYRVTLSSPDTRCKATTYELVSRKSGYVLISDIFLVPDDQRSIDERLTELTGHLLNKPVRAHALPEAYPDGLRKVEILLDTRFGPFFYHAWLDASNHFMLSGRRGLLSVDPGITYLAALGAEHAAPLTRTGSVEIVELSDLQCPSCRRGHEKMVDFLKLHGKDVRYSRLDLPIFEMHDYSFEAAIGARAIQKVAPLHYWSYVDFMFKNQEVINAKNFGLTFRNFLSDHDIDAKKIDPLFKSKSDREELLRQVGRAYDNGVFSTPTFIVNGQSVFWGTEADFVFKYITSLLPGGRAKATAKPSAKTPVKVKK